MVYDSFDQMLAVWKLFHNGRNNPRFTQGDANLESSNAIALPIEALVSDIPIDALRKACSSLTEKNQTLEISEVVEELRGLFDEFSKTNLGLALKLIAEIQNSDHLIFSPIFFDRKFSKNVEAELIDEGNIVHFFLSYYLTSLSQNMEKYSHLALNSFPGQQEAYLHFDIPDTAQRRGWDSPVVRVLFQEYVPEGNKYIFSAYAVKNGAMFSQDNIGEKTTYADLSEEDKEKLAFIGDLEIVEGDFILFSQISLSHDPECPFGRRAKGPNRGVAHQVRLASSTRNGENSKPGSLFTSNRSIALTTPE
jgi:hypothetical protein